MKPSPWLALKESLMASDEKPHPDDKSIEELAQEWHVKESRARTLVADLQRVGRVEAIRAGKRVYYRRVK
jgi:hypothetical protein